VNVVPKPGKAPPQTAAVKASMDARIKVIAARTGAKERPATVRCDPAVIKPGLTPRNRGNAYRLRAADGRSRRPSRTRGEPTKSAALTRSSERAADHSTSSAGEQAQALSFIPCPSGRLMISQDTRIEA
jgi:hypothetical protein